MEWFALIYPVAALIILHYNQEKLRGAVLFAESLLFVLPVFLILLCNGCMKEMTIVDKEVWGGWVTKVSYFEDWNEYIHQTCSQTDSEGKTTYYDCSYVAYYPEEYKAYTSNGETISISKNDYDTIGRKFGTKPVFVDMHRWHYTNDGDCYDISWTGEKEKYQQVFTQHNYRNKVNNTDNAAFTFDEISKKEAKQLGLFEYPEVYTFDMPVILGYATPLQKEAVWMNATMGASKQIRIIILCYQNKSVSIVEDQKNYWKNGNKNELVLCLGMNQDRIEWSSGFCWSPDSYSGNEKVIMDFADSVRGKTLTQESLDVLRESINKNWKRKSFKELEYLDTRLPWWGLFWIHVLTLIATIGLVYFVVYNEH